MSIPGLYTSGRTRRHGRKCSESIAQTGSELSACREVTLSPEGFLPREIYGEVLCTVAPRYNERRVSGYFCSV